MNVQDKRTKNKKWENIFLKIEALWESSALHENEFQKEKRENCAEGMLWNTRKFPETEEHESLEKKRQIT